MERIIQIVRAEPGWKVAHEQEGKAILSPLVLWGLDSGGIVGPIAMDADGSGCDFEGGTSNFVGIVAPGDSEDVVARLLEYYLKSKVDKTATSKNEA